MSIRYVVMFLTTAIVIQSGRINIHDMSGHKDISNLVKSIADGMSSTADGSLDRRYAAAVESGDNEKACEILRQYAKIKMPRTKVVDEHGLPLVVYHGTSPRNMFDVFDMSPENPNKMEHTPSGTAWFTSSHECASGYDGGETAMIYACFLDIENPAIADAKGESFKDDEWGFGDTKSGKGFSTGNFVRRAQAAQKDGAIIKNIIDDAGIDSGVATDYVAFYPEQIKYAVPTYDNGELIPLSKRFDFSTDDIRY